MNALAKLNFKTLTKIEMLIVLAVRNEVQLPNFAYNGEIKISI